MDATVTRPQGKRKGANSTLPPLPKRGPTAAEQKVLWNRQPIRRWTEIIVPTPVLIRSADHVVDRTDRGASGSVFIGTPQVGKSTLVRYLLQQLGQVFPQLPTFAIEFPPDMGASQMDFLAVMLGGIDANLPLAWPKDARRRQLITELTLRAAPHPDHWIVLLLDEVQNLDKKSLGWLKFIVGRLATLGVRVLVFSFAQPELLELIKRLKSQHQEPLLKRFFRERFRFDGIRSSIELRKVFELIDWAVRFPDPVHGWSCTQFYFPVAFEAGYRLANDAKTAWRAIKGDAAHFELGMDGLRDVTQDFFLKNSGRDGPAWSGGTPKQWLRAVASAPALHV
jgi:hypothetical protein